MRTDGVSVFFLSLRLSSLQSMQKVPLWFLLTCGVRGPGEGAVAGERLMPAVSAGRVP